MKVKELVDLLAVMPQEMDVNLQVKEGEYADVIAKVQLRNGDAMVLMEVEEVNCSVFNNGGNLCANDGMVNIVLRDYNYMKKGLYSVAEEFDSIVGDINFRNY